MAGGESGSGGGLGAQMTRMYTCHSRTWGRGTMCVHAHVRAMSCAWTYVDVRALHCTCVRARARACTPRNTRHCTHTRHDCRMSRIRRRPRTACSKAWRDCCTAQCPDLMDTDFEASVAGRPRDNRSLSRWWRCHEVEMAVVVSAAAEASPEGRVVRVEALADMWSLDTTSRIRPARLRLGLCSCSSSWLVANCTAQGHHC